MSELHVDIGGRRVGPGYKPYVIAELSGNHNGDLDRALALIEAAKAAGADAVKLQTYTADTMTIDHPGPDFQIRGGLWDGQSLYDLYKIASTPWEWHEALFRKGRELGIDVFSTPFDSTAVEFLETLGPPVYKIASFEMIDLPLIERVARTGKPIIMSTGMASGDEIDEAVQAARHGGCRDLIILHCISGYPTPPEEMNLRALPRLAATYGTLAGLSDHTLGSSVAVAAVALGAVVIEKHVTLRRADGGPDAAFSLEPEELSRLVEDVHTASRALGVAEFQRTSSETANVGFRRSLYVVEDVDEGELLTERNVRSIRPGYGLPPKYLPRVLGRPARRRLVRGMALSLDMVE